MPRGNTTLINPGLLGALADFAPQQCTIQERNQGSGTRGPTGQRLESFADFHTYIDIACRLAPAGGGPIKDPKGRAATRTHKLLLFGSYPLIKSTMRAVVDSQEYDVLVVHHDAQEKTTRLDVEVVE